MSERVEKEGKENRQVERKYLVFYLRVFDGLSTKVLGHVVNISSQGIMLLSDNAIALNEDYRLRMRLPSEMTDQGEIVFSATSRWCKKDVNPDFFVTGFQIHGLSADQKTEILSLIDEFGFDSC